MGGGGGNPESWEGEEEQWEGGRLGLLPHLGRVWVPSLLGEEGPLLCAQAGSFLVQVVGSRATVALLGPGDPSWIEPSAA